MTHEHVVHPHIRSCSGRRTGCTIVVRYHHKVASIDLIIRRDEARQRPFVRVPLFNDDYDDDDLEEENSQRTERNTCSV